MPSTYIPTPEEAELLASGGIDVPIEVPTPTPPPPTPAEAELLASGGIESPQEVYDAAVKDTRETGTSESVDVFTVDPSTFSPGTLGGRDSADPGLVELVESGATAAEIKSYIEKHPSAGYGSYAYGVTAQIAPEIEAVAGLTGEGRFRALQRLGYIPRDAVYVGMEEGNLLYLTAEQASLRATYESQQEALGKLGGFVVGTDQSTGQPVYDLVGAIEAGYILELRAAGFDSLKIVEAQVALADREARIRAQEEIRSLLGPVNLSEGIDLAEALSMGVPATTLELAGFERADIAAARARLAQPPTEVPVAPVVRPNLPPGFFYNPETGGIYNAKGEFLGHYSPGATPEAENKYTIGPAEPRQDYPWYSDFATFFTGKARPGDVLGGAGFAATSIPGFFTGTSRAQAELEANTRLLLFGQPYQSILTGPELKVALPRGLAILSPIPIVGSGSALAYRWDTLTSTQRQQAIGSLVGETILTAALIAPHIMMRGGSPVTVESKYPLEHPSWTVQVADPWTGLYTTRPARLIRVTTQGPVYESGGVFVEPRTWGTKYTPPSSIPPVGAPLPPIPTGGILGLSGSLVFTRTTPLSPTSTLAVLEKLVVPVSQEVKIGYPRTSGGPSVFKPSVVKPVPARELLTWTKTRTRPSAPTSPYAPGSELAAMAGRMTPEQRRKWLSVEEDSLVWAVGSPLVLLSQQQGSFPLVIAIPGTQGSPFDSPLLLPSTFSYLKTRTTTVPSSATKEEVGTEESTKVAPVVSTPVVTAVTTTIPTTVQTVPPPTPSTVEDVSSTPEEFGLGFPGFGSIRMDGGRGKRGRKKLLKGTYWLMPGLITVIQDPIKGLQFTTTLAKPRARKYGSKEPSRRTGEIRL